jgi:hypothetical protein
MPCYSEVSILLIKAKHWPEVLTSLLVYDIEWLSKVNSIHRNFTHIQYSYYMLSKRNKIPICIKYNKYKQCMYIIYIPWDEETLIAHSVNNDKCAYSSNH